MRFNTIFNLSSLLAFASLTYGSGYRMSFYGLNGNRPSDSAIPACGTDVHYDTDYYIALNQEQYTASQVKSNNPNTASVCDKCVKISYQGKWVVGRIVDSCPGCPYKGLDVSPTIFEVFADRDVGILYMDWEFTDCSLLGKSGSGGSSSSSKSSSGSSGSSGSSDNSDSGKKATTKKTATRKTTTYVNKKNTKTTSLKHYTVITTKVSHTTSKSIPTSEKLPTNVPELDGIIVNSTTNKTVAGAAESDKLNKANTIDNVKQNQSQNQTQNKNQVPVKNGDANPKTKSEPTVVEQSFSENKEEGGTSYALPITGALAVTGAAGIALVYVKRDSKNVNALKEKFPEAFSNIKRSISRGSTAVKRSLSQSGRALKRSLSMSGNDNSRNVQSAVGPRFRTKKEYRASLDAHYPLQGVQLCDPPVPSATYDYSYIPQYNAPHYNNTNNNNEDDNNLRIDFVDSYHH